MIMRTQSMFVIGLPLTRGPSLPLVWMVGLSSTKCPRKSRWKFWILILANSLDGNVTFWFYNVTLKRYRTILAILVSCFVFNTHNNIVYEFLKYFRIRSQIRGDICVFRKQHWGVKRVVIKFKELVLQFKETVTWKCWLYFSWF